MAVAASHNWPGRMRRRQASEYLAVEHGITLSPATLAKLAVTGGGPAFWKDGPFAIYGRDHLDQFAARRLGELRTSTSSVGAPCIRARACHD